MHPNPFIQRGRITDPTRFVGRWRELSTLFERLEAGRSVLVTGPSGSGVSSLLTHVSQAAAVNLDNDDLESLYVDLAVLPNAAACYRLVTTALGGSGDTSAALTLALGDQAGPTLLCLDGADRAVAAGWGVGLLEGLARIARRRGIGGQGDLLLVAAASGSPPQLSEPFAIITLGPLANSEVRLLAAAYLDEAEMDFSPGEIRDLYQLSGGHAALLQRAAYHLYASKTGGPPDWQSAYRAEVRDLPEAGVPLPPGIFAGELPLHTQDSFEDAVEQEAQRVPQLLAQGSASVLAVVLPLLAALAALLITGSWLVAGALFLVGSVVAVVWTRRG